MDYYLHSLHIFLVIFDLYLYIIGSHQPVIKLYLNVANVELSEESNWIAELYLDVSL